MNLEPSTSAVSSGTPLPPVPIPRPGHLSKRPPYSPGAVVVLGVIVIKVRLAVRIWPPADRILPSTTRTASSTSRRTTLLWLHCCPYDRKGGGPVVLILVPVGISWTRANFAPPLFMILLCSSHATHYAQATPIPADPQPTLSPIRLASRVGYTLFSVHLRARPALLMAAGELCDGFETYLDRRLANLPQLRFQRNDETVS